MTIVHCSGDEARDARDNTMGAEDDRPSWREAAADDPHVVRDAERACHSGVFVGGWELTHAAARRWADRNATGGDDA
jgi:hypothetical protein